MRVVEVYMHSMRFARSRDVAIKAVVRDDPTSGMNRISMDSRGLRITVRSRKGEEDGAVVSVFRMVHRNCTSLPHLIFTLLTSTNQSVTQMHGASYSCCCGLLK